MESELKWYEKEKKGNWNSELDLANQLHKLSTFYTPFVHAGIGLEKSLDIKTKVAIDLD